MVPLDSSVEGKPLLRGYENGSALEPATAVGAEGAPDEAASARMRSTRYAGMGDACTYVAAVRAVKAASVEESMMIK